MKMAYKTHLVVFISAFIFGCSSTSVQHVDKPDTNQPINENETIIQLKRADYLGSSLNNAFVVANDKSIGELANADELVWKTESNSLECISLEHGRGFMDIGIKLEDTPVSYKCFETKPQAIMTLTYDFDYPNRGLISYSSGITPVFKKSPTYGKGKKVAINVINSISSDAMVEQNFTEQLEKALKDQFRDNIETSSNRTVNIELLDLKASAGAIQWFAKSLEGSAYVKARVVIKENDQVVETFIVRPVLPHGGGLVYGSDELLAYGVAEDVFLHLFGTES
jgi:hypothetical protein